MKTLILKRSLRISSILFGLLVLTFHSLHGAESTPSATELAQQLRQHLNSLQSLSFQFSQQTRGQMTARIRQASGQAFFFRDGEKAKMRWDYQAPERQVIISDGDELSMYFEGLNQFIITPADSLQEDVTYSLFTGQNNIEDDFSVEFDAPPPSSGENSSRFKVIRLTPLQENSQIKQVLLWINEETKIKRIEIQDTFDTFTLLNLSDIRENILEVNGNRVDHSFFRFTPPEGTEIIRQ